MWWVIPAEKKGFCFPHIFMVLEFVKFVCIANNVHKNVFVLKMFIFACFSLLVSNDHIVYLSWLTTEVCLHYQNLRMENQGHVLPELEDPLTKLIR